MRITGWRVDGYGVLHDHHVHDLPAGITVLVGPNEAGKTTLLDFVRSVLFGFPDRRHARATHPPLAGGRHGGALELLGDDGRRWLLERHRDGDGPVLTLAAARHAPDGPAVVSGTSGEDGLRRLLGGADAELFRTVFAFGLAELSSLRLLESEDVRDLVFSAGVLGAGRSATRSVKALGARQAVLVRPRQADATANRLRTQLSEIERELRELRRAAEAYPEHAAELTRATERAGMARVQADACRGRLSDLGMLDRCRPIWDDRLAARAELGRLGPRTATASVLLARAPDIRLLARRRSGHEERVARRVAVDRQLAELDRTVTDALADLGGTLPGSWTVAPGPEHVAPRGSSVLVRQSCELTAHLDAAASELARSLSATLGRARDAATGSTGSPTTGARDATDALRSLGELRLLVGERDRLAAERDQRGHEERLASLAARRTGSRRTIGYVAAALALLAAGTAGAVATSHLRLGTGVAAVLAVAAVALAILAVAVAVAPPRDRGRAADAPGRDEQALGRVELDRIVEAVADHARAVGLPAAPSAVEVDVARTRLESVADAQQRVERLRALARTRSDLVATVHPLDSAIARFGRDVTELAADLWSAADGPRPPDAAAPESLDGLDGLDVLDVLEQMERGLADAERDDHRRSEIERSVAACDAELARALGTGPRAQRLLAELEAGDAGAWERERDELAARIVRADAERDELLRAQHELERELAELESSARVAELEAARSACQTELDTALERYAVLGIARALLARTLALYEHERQPAVVARAATLFATVTDGRYPRLLAQVGDESGGGRGIEAVTPSGARVDAAALSRGTAEQLYLCLRLALAESFAARTEALPLVLDDVLVNFDPGRAHAVARAVADYARGHQVLAFTCHPHVAQILASTAPGARVVELDRSAFASR